MSKLTKKHLIYALSDPRTSMVRYIGRSSSGFRRPRQHWLPTVPNDETHVHNWTKQLAAINIEPVIDILEEFEPNPRVHYTLNDAEKFWIGYWKMIGAELTNMTDGGDTPFSSYPEVREKISRAKIGKPNMKLRGRPSKLRGRKAPHVTAALLGKSQSAETIEKRTQKLRIPVMCNETGEKFSSAIMAATATKIPYATMKYYAITGKGPVRGKNIYVGKTFSYAKSSSTGLL